MRLLLTTLNTKAAYTDPTLKYLYCIVASTDMSVTLREYSKEDDRDFIFNEIIRGGYDIVYMDCFEWNISRIAELGSDLKTAQPHMAILLGGPEVSVETESFMRDNPWVDFIIRGECEKPFSQFIKEYMRIERASSSHYDRVDALTYRKDGKIVSNGRGSLPSMEKLPFPYKDLEVEQDKVVCYESSRQGSRSRSVSMPFDRVCGDMGYLLYKKTKEIEFIDRNFNYNLPRARNIWRHLIDKDNGVSRFTFRISVETLDDEVFRVLKKARKGLFRFKICFNESSLKNTERLADMDNIEIHVSITAGLPHMGYRDFARAFDMAYKTRPTCLNVEFLKISKASKFRDIAEKHGYGYRADVPHEVLVTDHMSASDFVKLKMIETVLRVFQNGGGFEKGLDFLIDELGFTPFNLYQRLADFYYGNMFHAESFDREKLYGILQRFAESFEEEDPGVSERMKRCLTMDILEKIDYDEFNEFTDKGWDLQ